MRINPDYLNNLKQICDIKKIIAKNGTILEGSQLGQLVNLYVFDRCFHPRIDFCRENTWHTCFFCGCEFRVNYNNDDLLEYSLVSNEENKHCRDVYLGGFVAKVTTDYNKANFLELFNGILDKNLTIRINKQVKNAKIIYMCSVTGRDTRYFSCKSENIGVGLLIAFLKYLTEKELL